MEVDSWIPAALLHKRKRKTKQFIPHLISTSVNILLHFNNSFEGQVHIWGRERGYLGGQVLHDI